MAAQIKLNRAEMRLAQYLAKERYRMARAADRPQYRAGDLETDLIGVMGEIAFAKKFNLYPSLALEPQPDDGIDAILEGKRIDIKATKYAQGRLLLPIRKNGAIRPDFYSLMLVDLGEDAATCAGFCSPDELIRPQNRVEIAGSTAYALNQKLLWDWKA